MIAASWACGAIVGALLTFFLFGRGAVPYPSLAEQPQEEAIKVKEELDPGSFVDRSEEPTPSSKTKASSTGSSLIAMNLIDPYSRMPTLGGWILPCCVWECTHIDHLLHRFGAEMVA